MLILKAPETSERRLELRLMFCCLVTGTANVGDSPKDGYKRRSPQEGADGDDGSQFHLRNKKVAIHHQPWPPTNQAGEVHRS